jgi:CysZ protein
MPRARLTPTAPRPAAAPRRSAAREFGSGILLVGRGLRMWVTSPKLMLLGAIPALIVAAIYLAGILVLLVNIDSLATAATPYATDWDAALRTTARVATGAAILVVAALAIVFTFVAVTLTVGDPFYEAIWRRVESQLGEVPTEAEVGFWRSLGRGIGDGIRLIVPAVLTGLAIFLIGLVPVAGSVAAAVLGAFVGGWAIALELTGRSFEARGRSLRERRRSLRGIRPRTLGFGVSVYALFLVPFGAVIVMPAAVAGAAMLARDALANEAPATSTAAGAAIGAPARVPSTNAPE